MLIHRSWLSPAPLRGPSIFDQKEPSLTKCTGAKPRIVHAHGSEFCNAELRAVIKAHDLIDISTRVRHSEFSGIVECRNGTVRQVSEDYYGDNYLIAQRKVQQLVDEYNKVRLHVALGYFEPRELLFGNRS